MSANYRIAKPEEISKHEVPDGSLCLFDMGPWDQFMTVTNAAEEVVQELFQRGKLKPGQRLVYYDSEGDLDEILVQDGKFAGFKALLCKHQPEEE